MPRPEEGRTNREDMTMANDLASEFKGVMVSPFRARYDNFINGEFRVPNAGRYFTNTTRSPARPSARSPARRLRY